LTWEQLNELPYHLQADPAESLPDLLRKQAGTGKLTDAALMR